MRNTYITAALALFLSGAQSLSLDRLNNHSELVGIGVRFAEGMNGDEDLGQTITMKGEKYKYRQQNEAANVNPLQAIPGLV